MLDFLNEHIGIEEATYIGMFLAVIALFFGAKKVLNRIKQIQKVKNGNGIQAGGNVTINNSQEGDK